MKNIRNLFFPIFLIMLVSAGCNKKLDLFPYDSIATSQSFQTVSDAKAWSNGMYAFLRGRVYGIYMFSTDVQSDLLNATQDFGNRNGSPHRWDFTSDDYTIRDMWRDYYSALKSINEFLSQAPNISTTTSAEAEELKKYLGEAYFFRAFYYSNLVLRWAKAYNPSTAASDLGVPLILEFDVEAKPARSTVEQVYTQILSDITDAKSNLAISGSLGAKRLTVDAVSALEARVKLYMHDWAGAKKAADDLINAGKYPLATTQAKLADIWQKDANDETIFKVAINKTNETPNTNGIYLGFIAQTKYYRPDFVPSKWVVDLYSNSDFRKSVYFKQDSLDIQGIKFYDIYLVHKYEGNPAYFTAATTNYFHEPKVFRIAEMYLISAEAAYNNGGDALTPLNALRTKRNLPALSGISGAALLEEIKNERLRELAFEGNRLDDLKRWNTGMTRHDPQNIEFLTGGTGYYNLSKPAGDNKFVWGLPANDITINPNLKGQQNPGW